MTRKLLLTGAAGKIGSFFHNAFANTYEFLLSDIVEPADTKGAPFSKANLSDMVAIRPLFDGVDTVVHLGANPNMDAPWESLLPDNVVATFNVFEAARQAGCRRVVYASSINAVLGYPVDQQVHTAMPVYPINLYGATKCWGEALARYYSHTHGLSSLCLLFGAVQYRDSEMIHWDHEYVDIIPDAGRQRGADRSGRQRRRRRDVRQFSRHLRQPLQAAGHDRHQRYPQLYAPGRCI